jgi:hypothetical protein
MPLPYHKNFIKCDGLSGTMNLLQVSKIVDKTDSEAITTMKKIILILMLGMLLMVGAVNAQTVYYNEPTIEAHLMRYIDAINWHDYAAAYAMNQGLEQSYQEFVAGFDQTERIVPYFGVSGAAAGTTYVTTVLLGYQNDGTVESYYGTFRVSHGSLYSPPQEGWVLHGGDFQLIQDGMALHNSTIQTLIRTQWQENPTLPNLTTLSEMSDYPADVVLDYYDLISEGNYQLAYNQWLTPATHGVSRDYRLTYQQFVNGYRDTAYVTAYVGGYQSIPANQQRSYLSLFVPVVLVGQHRDGTYVTYSGCYALGYLSTNMMGIVNGRFQLLMNDVPDAPTIFNALNTQNCAALGMGL